MQYGRSLYETNELLGKAEVNELAAQVFAKCQRVLVVNGHKGTSKYADVLSWLAVTVDKSGRHAQAVVLGEEMLETREKLGQKGSAEWLIAVNNLGFSLTRAGQSNRAIETLLLGEQFADRSCEFFFVRLNRFV